MPKLCRKLKLLSRALLAAGILDILALANPGLILGKILLLFLLILKILEIRFSMLSCSIYYITNNFKTHRLNYIIKKAYKREFR